MRLASFKIDSVAKYGIVTDTGVVDLTQRAGGRYPDLRSVIANDGVYAAPRLVTATVGRGGGHVVAEQAALEQLGDVAAE